MGKSVPVINQWYQDIAVNRLFEVIAVDEYSALIDIRYAAATYENIIDGDADDDTEDNSGLDEISFDDWAQMMVIPARPPEDWRTSFGEAAGEQMTSDDIIMPIHDASSVDTLEAADYLFGWDEF